ncbi:alpha-L-fucosidase [Rufibacter glacialis]|uniref:alpha-L-fucosidase n=1 Tax=Rufibacter glacialis TaxID=1259555 RepID=A0A5M8QC20_9BACT|nr:alpha-L-fucosidase [Rufibacter glacialis]KAA6432440.1 alpha-L-fucosidase [Rufibacter glacialis]GGK78683.1 alpha-1,3/4-fucosidase [Rufibacter glacialis]
MKRIASSLFALLLTGASAAFAQQGQEKNYVLIKPEDSMAEIIKKAAHVVPSPRQLKWQQLELTAFFHFGVNTFTNREWGTGKEDPKIFNPSQLDARQWVRVAKEAGIKQVILTAKHHDGFCLWPTATTDHSVKSSPWKGGKGDLVKEVAEACKEYGIGFGVYLSPWDMNSPVYGTEAYNDLFIAQLTELLTQYGPIEEVWFDGANGEGPNGKKQVYDFERWYQHIRKLQPAATIAVMGPDIRWVGTETGYGRETEWSVVPANNLDQTATAANSQQGLAFKPQGDMRGTVLGGREQIRNATGLVWYPAETDVSIRPGWFHHPKEDQSVKTPEKLLDIYYSSVGRNSVLLLNLPPDTRGLIHEADVKNLQGWKRLRDETFKVNYAQKAKIKAAGGKNLNAILDGKYNTYFTTSSEKDTTAVIELQLKGQQTFDVLMLQENIAVGQRIESFVLEYLDGQTWKKATEGTTVGYKRLLRFNPVTASKVRLRILSSRLNPTLSEFGLYQNALLKEGKPSLGQ